MTYATSAIWQVVDKVWEMLEAQAEFAALVPSANRVKYSDTINRNPDLDVPSDDDYVRVRIVPDEVKPSAYRTSNGSMFTLVLRVETHTGDRRIHLWSEPLEAIYKAFTTWRTYLQGVTWQGDDFAVCFCRLMEDANAIKMDRVTAGWQSVAIAEIDIWYQSTDINGT